MLSNCTRTVGEENGTFFLVYASLTSLALLIFLFLFGPRFKQSLDSGDKYSIELNGIALLSTVVLLIGSIDPMGMFGRVTYHVYFISDEIAAAALLCNAVIMINGIVRVGRSVSENKKVSLVQGLPTSLMLGSCVFFFFIFFVTSVIAMVDKDNYLFWSGIKGVGGGLNLLFIMTIVHKHINTILGNVKTLPEEKQKELKAKFKRCLRAGYSIAFVLCAASILDFFEPDARFKIIEGFDGLMIWVIFRVVFIVGLYIYYTTNKVPGKGGKSGGSTKTTTSVSKSTVAPEQ